MPLRRVGRPGLIGTMARTAVVAGTASATAGAVSRRQQKRHAQKDAEDQALYEQEPGQAAQQTAPVQAAPSVGGQPEYMQELQQLAQLKSQGIITEEEFQAKKRQLLGL